MMRNQLEKTTKQMKFSECTKKRYWSDKNMSRFYKRNFGKAVSSRKGH